jgi:hypothetical protein
VGRVTITGMIATGPVRLSRNPYRTFLQTAEAIRAFRSFHELDWPAWLAMCRAETAADDSTEKAPTEPDVRALAQKRLQELRAAYVA